MLALALAAAAQAQAPPGPLPPKPGATPQQPPPREQRPIRVQVELVTTPVTVRDAAGELVFDLEQRHFRVLDNGVEQRIEHFDLGGDPLSVAIVLETSSRVEPMLEAVRRTGILFTQTVLGQTGEAAVLAVDDSTEVLLPFSADHDRIEKAIAQLRMGTSGLRLYDALSHAVGLLRNRPATRRRVIVVVSEAADTGSETKLGEVLREAQLSNITIYSVGLSTTAAALRASPRSGAPPSATPPGTFGLPGRPGTVQTPTTEQQSRGNIDLLAVILLIIQNASNAVRENALELATVATGGMHVPTFRDRSIEKAIDQIGGELHAQYSLSYRPQGTQPWGYHEIKVVVARPGVNVRARPGYYTGPPEEK
jgi:VWFA-related protein